jgi:Fe-S cluster assembly iron-binding protein IscA
MLNITEAAGEYLTAVLERANAPEYTAIRIRLEDGGLSPALDLARPGDETFDHNGRLVLLLDGGACDYLSDSTLDVDETPDGPKLLILQ